MKTIPNYWDPIFIIEYEQAGFLFPLRIYYYHETKEEVLKLAGRFVNVIRVLEKSMYTGKEEVIR